MADRCVAFRLGLCLIMGCQFLVGFGVAGRAIAAPTVPAPTVNPGAMTGGTSVSVKASVDITDSTLIAGSVQLLQVNEANVVIARLGGMTDDGVVPDLVAGDHVYVKQVVIAAPSAPGKVRLRVSAAFTGMLQRVLSDVTVIDVTPVGVPTSIGISDPTKVALDAITGFEFISNEVIVAFKEGVSLEEVQRVVKLVGGELIGRIPELSVWQVRIPDTGALAGVQAAMAILVAQPSVKIAEPNMIPRASSHETNYRNTLYFPQLGLAAAQGLSKGKGVKIAVIDTGIDASHPELKSHLIRGLNVVELLSAIPEDKDGHGTHVTGIVTMIAPDSKLMPIRGVSGPCEPSLLKTLIKYPTSVLSPMEGLVHAATQKVQIANLSLGVHPFVSGLMKLAVLYAQSQGVLVVASAGNDNTSTAQSPADFLGVLSVGASDFQGQRSIAADSNYGTWVKVYAPGETILSTWPSYSVSGEGCVSAGPSGLKVATGTSQAAPFASGVGALVKAHSPRLSAGDLHDVLVKSAAPSEIAVSGIYKKAAKDPDGNIICLLKADRAISMGETYLADPNARKRKPCSGPFIAVHHPGGTSSVDFSLSVDGSPFQRISVGADSGDIVYLTNPLTTINPLSQANPSTFPPLAEGVHTLTILLNLSAFEFKVAGYTLTLSPGLKFADGTTTKSGLLNRAIRLETHDFEILADSGGPGIPLP